MPGIPTIIPTYFTALGRIARLSSCLALLCLVVAARAALPFVPGGLPMPLQAAAIDGSALQTPPALTKRGYAYFPEHLLYTQSFSYGRVILRLELDAAGKIVAIKVASASDPDFIPPAVGEALDSKFSPAKAGGVACPSYALLDLNFTATNRRESEINNLEALPHKIAGTEAKYDYDVAPRLLSHCDPAYPVPLLRTKTKGSATVQLVVDSEGIVAGARVISASDPAFGTALVAAAETWRFFPATLNDRKTQSLVQYTYSFVPAGFRRRAAENDGLKEMLRGGKKFVNATDLDAKLKVLYQVAPQYPRGLLATKPRGEATIEFIVGADGTAVLPVLVSATDPLFGEAAMVAVQQWIYMPPTSKGKAVSARTRMSFDFAP